MEGEQQVSIITADRVKHLVAKVCRDDIDDEAADILAAMADEVLISIVSSAANVAKNRSSNEVTINDMRIACERDWGIPFEDVLQKMPGKQDQ
jgi:histone H3/H4